MEKEKKVDKIYEESETGCCPRFNPEPWNEKTHTWKHKLFLKDRVRSFLHIPLGFGRVMKDNVELIKRSDALVDVPLMLCDEESPWKTTLYIAVSKEVQNAEMTKLSGTFLTKVFEGPFKNIGKWRKEMTQYAKSQGKGIKKMYSCYTTCPHCAKVYGKNYVVLLAQI